MPKKSLSTRVPLIKLFWIYLLIFCSWLIYRYLVRIPDLEDSLIFKPLIWLLPIFIIGGFKISLAKPKISGILISLIAGVLLALIQIIPHGFTFGNFAQWPVAGFITVVLVSLSTGMVEELLFRGFFLTQLQLRFSKLIANFSTSILFTLIHLPIILFINQYSGLTFSVNLYVLMAQSLLFGYLFIYTRNISSPIIAHFINNLLLSLVI